MKAPEAPRRCRACKEGELHPAVWYRTFAPLGEKFEVELLTSRCNACGAEFTNGRQHDENLQRLAARKPKYGPMLMGEEIVTFRLKYGLTQKMAARIFGKGLIAFSRYENEASYPDLSMTKLLKQAMANPKVLKALADEEGVDIPLWEVRCEDERKGKLHLIQTRRELPVEAVAPWTSSRHLAATSWPSAREQSLAKEERVSKLSANDEVYQEAMTS